MKIPLVFLSGLICIQLFACNENNKIEQTNNANNNSNRDTTKMKITITVGSASFAVTLNNSTSARAFKSKLPITINMTELNGNEKYCDLPNDLPTNASNPGTIRAGDLMLYGRNTLVLFYKTFSTSYNYTQLGRIDNPSGLAEALGSGNVTVKLGLHYE